MNKDIDLTIISNIMMADGIGRQGAGLLSALKDKLSINVHQMQPRSFKDIPPDILKILVKSFTGWGKVCFHTHILGLNKDWIPLHQSIDSKLKISYSMIESTNIPELWTEILNNFYDLVVVPDQSLVSVYKNSGVKIPIFVIPLGIFIEHLLGVPLKDKPGNPFVFGFTSGFWKRKNHTKLLRAFAKEFGNDPSIKLRLHGRFGPNRNEVEGLVKELNLSNLDFYNTPLSGKDYESFMRDIDCYVAPSSGEGYSIGAREAVALGIPSIVANNTAQQTICNSGFVVPLKSDKRVAAYYEVFNKNIGSFFDCDQNDLGKLMKEVVNNYDKYLKQVQSGGREWVSQYLWTNLSSTYYNLVKPTNIVLGNSNLITPDCFQTNSQKLFNTLRRLND